MGANVRSVLLRSDVWVVLTEMLCSYFRETRALICVACAASGIYSWKPDAGCCVSTQERQCPCNTQIVGYKPKTMSVQTNSERIIEDTLGSINKLICCSNRYSFN